MRILRFVSVSAALAALALATACTSDNNGGTPSQPTLDAAFLGYSNPANQQTTCGNCHTNLQVSWAKTGHASAWADLQASGHASAACYGCHTVSGLTNSAPDSTGYFAVDSTAKKYYEDVQCESCHGPGASHVQAPDETQPIPTIAVSLGATSGCATCHNGAHHPFTEDWSESAHSTVLGPPTSNSSSSCRGCHTGQGALARFDTRANYAEINSGVVGNIGSWQPITCAVCHDPHGSANDHELRFPINTLDINTNLCMQCHNRRAVPDPTSSSGPHTPQGETLLGESGWQPQNLPIVGPSSHGSESNPQLCAGCHVVAFSVNDANTGSFLRTATGHRFEAIPCVDANGAPDTTVTDCTAANRTFAACAVSGCHSSTAAAMNAWQADSATVNSLARVLWVDKNGNGSLDASPTDGGLLATVKLTTPGDFLTNDAFISVAEGAFFNARLPGVDGSGGAHNPAYMQALLSQTIVALRGQYAYLPAPPAGVQAIMTRSLARATVASR